MCSSLVALIDVHVLVLHSPCGSRGKQLRAAPQCTVSDNSSNDLHVSAMSTRLLLNIVYGRYYGCTRSEQLKLILDSILEESGNGSTNAPLSDLMPGS